MFRDLIPLVVAFFLIAACSPAYGQGRFGEADANQDGKVDTEELTKFVSGKLRGFDQFEALFKELDTDGDDVLDEQEFKQVRAAARKMMGAQPRRTRKPGDANRSSPHRPSLKVGDVAPTFNLKSLDGKSETNLAFYKGRKPVVLIFGSFS